MCKAPERTYSRVIPTQYSVEQRDDLKLALKVSRREPVQISEPRPLYLDHVGFAFFAFTFVRD